MNIVITAFSDVGYATLANCALVCRTWYSWCRPSLYSRLIIKGPDIRGRVKELVALSRDANYTGFLRYVRAIRLYCTTAESRGVLPLLPKCLRDVDRLEFCRDKNTEKRSESSLSVPPVAPKFPPPEPPYVPKIVPALLCAFTSLQSLSLSSYDFGNFSNLVRIIKCMPRLGILKGHELMWRPVVECSRIFTPTNLYSVSLERCTELLPFLVLMMRPACPEEREPELSSPKSLPTSVPASTARREKTPLVPVSLAQSMSGAIYSSFRPLSIQTVQDSFPSPSLAEIPSHTTTQEKTGESTGVLENTESAERKGTKLPVDKSPHCADARERYLPLMLSEDKKITNVHEAARRHARRCAGPCLPTSITLPQIQTLIPATRHGTEEADGTVLSEIEASWLSDHLDHSIGSIIREVRVDGSSNASEMECEV
ncbi:hypothetical protein NM688_g9013 [Phlebia brevispora]|uniref:Uncharacterized protein n=1 Tax=Phlebia brevispora TaxID=194682 RepID=A0ACC1RLM4_9APHY|nr:hypothetical protein NM688_g9013 [Phlebia brevispora]